MTENTGGGPALVASDEAIRERTGRGWDEWFALLDAWGAAERPHREIARWVAEQQGVEPLAWDAQAIAVSYERARGLRAIGETDGGFTANASKTVAAPVERLYAAFADEALRAHWLPGGRLRERTATRPRSARFDWDDDGSRVNVGFTAKGPAKSAVALAHERLADAEEAEAMRAYWRERLTALASLLERGDP